MAQAVGLLQDQIKCHDDPVGVGAPGVHANRGDAPAYWRSALQAEGGAKRGDFRFEDLRGGDSAGVRDWAARVG